MQQVQLNWRGPYRLGRAFEVEASKDWGIYAICRRWGEAAERVLYIGQTYFQELGQRLRQHKWLNDLKGDIKVRFAAIELEEGSKQSQKRAKDIEALLTYCHQPQYNIQNRKSYRGRRLDIISYGRRGPIEQHTRSADL